MGRELPAAGGVLKRALWRFAAVRSLHNLHAARRDAALLDPQRPSPAPVLVYQMAKVGSTTVHATLDALDPPRRPVLKVHFLSRAGVARERALDRRVGGRTYLSYQAALGHALGERLRRFGGRFSLPVITLVRDPIAREVSGLFQSPAFAGVPLTRRDGRFDAERMLAHLERLFVAQDPCRVADRWFDEEIRPLFDIDVFALPFPRERGYSILRGPAARLLVLRMEDLDRCLGPALAELLDLPKEPRVVRSNVRERSPDAAEYAAVRERFRLPREIVEEIYARRLTRHFYPRSTIEAFTARWARD